MPNAGEIGQQVAGPGHGRAQGVEAVGKTADRGADLAVGVDQGMLVEHKDAVIGERTLPRGGQVEPVALGLLGLGSGQDAKRQVQVFGAAGQRPNDRQRDRAAVEPGRRMAAQGDQVVGGLVAIDAAEGRRYADRAADVRPELQRNHPRRQRRGAAARGAAR